MELKPGLQLASAVCTARVVVVKVPADRTPEIACGGHPMVPVGEDAPSAEIDPALAGGVLLGKRYEGDGLEVLCSAAGDGTLTSDGRQLTVKTAKPLPASD
jgi:hypothetical protein